MSDRVGFAFAAPGVELETRRARAALPRTVSHADAVHNVGAMAALLRALETGDATAAAAQYGRYERWRFRGDSADFWYSRASLLLAQKAQQPAVRLQALLQAQAAAAAVKVRVTAFNMGVSGEAGCPATG